MIQCCCCSCSCLSVSAYVPYLCDVGVFCWNFPSASMHSVFRCLSCRYLRNRMVNYCYNCSRYDSLLRDMSCGFVLLNCGYRVYARVNSFLVWISSCIEGCLVTYCFIIIEISEKLWRSKLNGSILLHLVEICRKWSWNVGIIVRPLAVVDPRRLVSSLELHGVAEIQFTLQSTGVIP